MKLLDLLRQYFASNKAVKAYELTAIQEQLKAHISVIQGLDQKIGAIEAKIQGSNNQQVLERLNQLRADVEKLKSRLIGYSKTGIS